MIRLAWLALIMPITALAADGDYKIVVTGTIQSSVGIPVALYVGPSGGKCSGQAEATTDSKGSFSFVHTVERSWRESFAVFVRTFTLCAREGGSWIELWSFRTGPPPKTIAFECPGSITSKVDCRVEWDGRPLRNVQPNSRLVPDAYGSPLRTPFSAAQPER
jgi:hypothetical protein